MRALTAQGGGEVGECGVGGCEESSQAARQAKQMVSQVPAQQEVCLGAEPGSPWWVRWGSEEHRCWEQSWIKLGWMRIGTEMTYMNYEEAVRTGSEDMSKAVNEKVNVYVERAV